MREQEDEGTLGEGKGERPMTQTELILNHVQLFGSITPLEALKEYGIMRLASRVHDLKKQGIDLKRTMETAKNRFGEPVHYMRYSL